MRICIIICIIPLLYFQSCTSQSGHNKKDSLVNTSHTAKNNIAFQSFLKKFKLLSLPLEIRSNDRDIEEADTTKKFSKADNVFIKSGYPDSSFPYGLLPDTTNYYKIIWLAPAEDLYPVLTVYSKSGKKISEKNLSVGGCGSDCGFMCNEIITIDKNFNIYVADTIKSSECDTNGNIKSNTTEHYVNYMTGNILKNGKIYMSKVLKEALNK